MEWNTLKEEIYFWDGSWRDIYIKNIDRIDWKKWIEFVNQRYRLHWNNEKTEKEESRIDFEVISEYWDGNKDLISTASFYIGDLRFNVHFFDETEIENDIDPAEFTSIENHRVLIQYLKDVSLLLNKEVILTPENMSEIILIRVSGELVQISKEGSPPKWEVLPS